MALRRFNDRIVIAVTSAPRPKISFLSGAVFAGVYRYASRLLQQARCLRQLPSCSSAAVERIAGGPAWLGGMINQENRIFTSGFGGYRSMFRYLSMAANAEVPTVQESAGTSTHIDQPQRIKFKRLDKTAKHIMNILDKEAVETVQSEREIPDIKPGYIIQLKVEVPENKRRVSTIKGIVIARRNAGLNTTFRLRRLVAGVGVESVFPLYSPNIKEVKILDKKKVRRAKLYYLRDRMNPLKK